MSGYKIAYIKTFYFKIRYLGIFGLIGGLLATQLGAQVELTVLIHHRQLDPELGLRSCYRALATADRACNKDSGGFGHAWIWIHGVDESGRLWDVEVGHTGETDASQPTYLEELMRRVRSRTSVSQLTGLLPKDREEDSALGPLAVLEEDRYDGQLESGSGGHLPDGGWSMTLSEASLKKLLLWICHSYDFTRYNLTNHQCCHFVVEALSQIGVKVELKASLIWPREIIIWGERLEFYRGETGRFALQTPWELSRVLSQSELGFTPGLESYFKRQGALSKMPLIRAWQRRTYWFNFWKGAPKQIQREFWLLGWRDA